MPSARLAAARLPPDCSSARITSAGVGAARAAIYLGATTGESHGDIGPDLLALFPEFERMQQEDGHGAPSTAAAAATLAAPRLTRSRDEVVRALEQCGGNRAAASRALGIGRTTLWRLLKADETR